MLVKGAALPKSFCFFFQSVFGDWGRYTLAWSCVTGWTGPELQFTGVPFEALLALLPRKGPGVIPWGGRSGGGPVCAATLETPKLRNAPRLSGHLAAESTRAWAACGRDGTHPRVGRILRPQPSGAV
jgi:hypothetical protein